MRRIRPHHTIKIHGRCSIQSFSKAKLSIPLSISLSLWTFVFCTHAIFCLKEFIHEIQRLHGGIARDELNTNALISLTRLGGNDNGTICCPRTIKRCCRSPLKHGHAFYIVWVNVLQVIPSVPSR